MADNSVTLAVCPLVGSARVAVAHKNSIVLTSQSKSIAIPTPQPVRALAFVPIAQMNALQTTSKSILVDEIPSEDSANSGEASSYVVTGGDDKVLTLLHFSGSAVSVVDTHGPVGKKVSHLMVVPTVGSAASTRFSPLKAKTPTGIAPYAPGGSASFATKEAPSVALTEEKDDEEHDDNNVKASGLSARDAYAVVAGRYYPNQVANVIFANKFGEVYAIALLQTPTGLMFGPAPVFLLQHFSVLSTMALVTGCNTSTGLSNTGRIVTCDRDAHTRVSKYPATFDIEQFLWAPYCKPEEGEEQNKRSQQVPIASVVAGVTGTTSLFTGDAEGRVTKWESSLHAPQQAQWKIQGIKTFVSEAPTNPAPTNWCGVVGMAVIDTHRALLVARDHIKELFVYFEDDSEDKAVQVTIPNESSIVQLVSASSADGTVVALLRDGSLHAIRVHRQGAPQRAIFTPLIADLSPSTADDVAAGKWSDSLKTVDLYYGWKSQFAENKSKREEEKSATEEKNNSNPKTNGNSKKKQVQASA